MSSNCGVKGAIFYKDIWLHPKSEAFDLHKDPEKRAELDKHLKQVKKAYDDLILPKT